MDSKKKVLVVAHAMRIGGAERSLIGLLNCIDYSLYEVDLFLFAHDGEFMNMIPPQVNLLRENPKYGGLLYSVKENLEKMNLGILWAKLKAKQKAKNYCEQNHLGANNLVYPLYFHKYALRHLPVVSEKVYDFGISFLTPHYILADKFSCRKKIAWIHTDYSYFDFDQEEELKMWSEYDYIASISTDCTDAFIGKFPSLADRIVLIENILSAKFIEQQATAFGVEGEMDMADSVTTLLSVGRFAEQKNFTNVPDICKKIRALGANVKWYLIGYGGEEDAIRKRIQELDMQEFVIILGKKENPYPYMRACDIYVQPSLYEGKAVTVREAQILCKPVVITAFATAPSQLEDGETGIIVPMDLDGCAMGIYSLITNNDKQQYLSRQCATRDFGNSHEVEKLMKLI